MTSDFVKARDSLESIPTHILAWIKGNATVKTAETDVIAYISGSYGIVVAVLKKVAEPDFKALETGMQTSAETTFAAAPGDILAKLAASGAAALAAGVALLAGDLAEAFKEITAEEKANLLHTLATSKATEASVPAA